MATHLQLLKHGISLVQAYNIIVDGIYIQYATQTPMCSHVSIRWTTTWHVRTKIIVVGRLVTGVVPYWVGNGNWNPIGQHYLSNKAYKTNTRQPPLLRHHRFHLFFFYLSNPHRKATVGPTHSPPSDLSFLFLNRHVILVISWFLSGPCVRFELSNRTKFWAICLIKAHLICILKHYRHITWY